MNRKEYYEQNKEKCIAQNKAWRAANPDKCVVYQKRFRRKFPEYAPRYQADWYAMNMAVYREDGLKLKEARENHGMLQRELTEKIGVTDSAISQYETGRVRIPWEKVIPLFPELEGANV